MEQSNFFASAGNRFLGTLALVSAIAALAAFAYAQIQESNYRFSGPVIIDVQGEGEVLAKPDIGTFSFAVQAEGEDAAAAQSDSAESINAIIEYLEEAGVEEKDIKTENYSLNPKYRYEERICPVGNFCPPGERVVDGYTVNQRVTVKVRDIDSAGEIISGVGERGATNISGLSFTIDDESVLEADARAIAIADARAKAEVVAKDLGMRVGKIVNFYQQEGGYGGYYPEARAMSFDMAMEEAAVPELPTGENTIRKTVNISFELK